MNHRQREKPTATYDTPPVTLPWVPPAVETTVCAPLEEARRRPELLRQLGDRRRGFLEVGRELKSRRALIARWTSDLEKLARRPETIPQQNSLANPA